MPFPGIGEDEVWKAIVGNERRKYYQVLQGVAQEGIAVPSLKGQHDCRWCSYCLDQQPAHWPAATCNACPNGTFNMMNATQRPPRPTDGRRVASVWIVIVVIVVVSAVTGLVLGANL